MVGFEPRSDKTGHHGLTILPRAAVAVRCRRRADHGPVGGYRCQARIDATDRSFLLSLDTGARCVDEVNFWQPGGKTNFRALREGELFLFRLHLPRNFIVSWGVFARADILPTSLAWGAFGVSNGAATLEEM
jgi:hypothetical protein